MEPVVQKLDSLRAADEADLEHHRQLSGDEKLQLLLALISPENPHEAVIERSARAYPLAAGGGR